MSLWLWVTIVLAVGALLPAMVLASRGGAVERLIGLELTGVVVAVAMLTYAQSLRQTSYFIVPEILVVLSFAGVLVYTRLVGPRG